MDYYKTTILEDWVIKKYKGMHIIKPDHIDIKYVARYFHIYIHLSNLPTDHKILGRYRGIFLNNRLTSEEKREAFFHEFCHIQRHAGIQCNMPGPFRELQEWDAANFTLYAAIPYHMIQFIPFDEASCIYETARIFKVTPELAEKRINQIRRRLL
jgi:hypothetical protein